MRLPKKFRIRRKGMRAWAQHSALPEPTVERDDVSAWLAKLDEYLDEPFMPEGRQQPLMPPPRKPFA